MQITFNSIKHLEEATVCWCQGGATTSGLPRDTREIISIGQLKADDYKE
jgi:hypothetical protein